MANVMRNGFGHQPFAFSYEYLAVSTLRGDFNNLKANRCDDKFKHI